MLLMLKLSQAGDTIVEVLISVGIVGLMLTGAFTISNASQKQIRMAQERSEAQRVAQSTVELLNPLVQKKPSMIAPGSLRSFCITTSLETLESSANECKQGDENRYRVEVNRNASNLRTFHVTVFWNGLSDRKEQLTMDYRVKG